MSNYAIETDRIGIAFDGVKVLDDVSVRIERGHVHALLGSNGAGKSTLMKILNGVYQAESGTMKLNGQPTRFNSPEEARRLGVGMVYQDLSLIETLTVSENVYLTTNPFRSGVIINDKRAELETAKLLEMIGLSAEISPRSTVNSLSSGQRQLVEIAKALATDPKILVLDEPTASLSSAEISSLFAVLRRLQQRGMTCIYITHYLEDVFEICDDFTMLRDGKVVLAGKVCETSVDELVRQMRGDGAEVARKARTSTACYQEQPLLSTDRLSTASISDVSLDIYPGEIVGLAGLLGSGRSEVLRALYGLDRQTGGEIKMGGKGVRLRSPDEAIAHGISLVPENRREQGLVLDFSVASNMIMSSLRHFTRKFFVDQRAEAEHTRAYIERLKIKTRGPHQVVRFLSGGNQQKIVVAKCLSHRTRILLLDDPTFGVDVRAKDEIMHIIFDYAAKGNGVLFVSSEFSELATCCDRVYIMKRQSIKERLSGQLTQEDISLKVH